MSQIQALESSVLNAILMKPPLTHHATHDAAGSDIFFSCVSCKCSISGYCEQMEEHPAVVAGSSGTKSDLCYAGVNLPSPDLHQRSPGSKLACRP